MEEVIGEVDFSMVRAIFVVAFVSSVLRCGFEGNMNAVDPQSMEATYATVESTEIDVTKELKVLDVAGQPNAGRVGADVSIGVYETLELVFQASETPANPFDTYLLKLEITDPNGRTFAIDGFYDGDGNGGQSGNVWKARITPYMLGTWQWQTVPGDVNDASLVGQSGTFLVGTSNELGGLISDGRYFHFQTGEPIYLVGNFLDFVSGLRTTHTFMSETTSDEQRDAIITRQREFHTSNKANIYFANKGDYNGQSVTPWLGTAENNDKSRMDLERWQQYDEYILRFKRNRMFAEMWFFADDSSFGNLSEADRNRLLRYAMARTSAFNHTLFVIALEWQEGFTSQEISLMGQYIQELNPWNRPASVHSTTQSDWKYADDDWPTFIASQAGNSAGPGKVNAYAIDLRNSDEIPHIGEEFGRLDQDHDTRLRQNLWANFCGGAVGSGTGSDLKAFQRFIQQSRVPFQRMAPANTLVSGGGTSRFVLAEPGHHYVVYSMDGAFTLEVTGSELEGHWFNPRDSEATLSDAFSIGAGTHNFTPPDSEEEDWVLWITDGSNLTSGLTHPYSGIDLSHFNYLPLLFSGE